MQPAHTLLDVLFASLWQDALIGIISGVILLVAAKHVNAASRHAVLQAALLVMIVCPAATTLADIGGNVVVSGHGIAASTPTLGASELGGSRGGLRRIGIVLANPIVTALISTWIAGALFFTLRIVLGVLNLSRVMRQSEEAGARNGVRVYSSRVLRVPIALGLVRPAIIVPADLIERGGTDLECVLLHELAHVRRRDAWSHALERIAHAFLFFNPAVVLVLQSLELEREAACDDWAVAHTRDTDSYARSLAALAIRTSYNAEMPAACGAIGFGHGIVQRIERLQDTRRNASLFLSPMAFGGFVFMLVSIALALDLLAPAVAFSTQPSVASTSVSTTCRRDVTVALQARPPSAPLPSGKAVVKVSVSAAGAVTGAKIAHSSGNAIVDRTALKMAKESRYEPAMRDCKPAAGTFLFLFMS